MKVIFGGMEFGQFRVADGNHCPVCLVRWVHAIMDLPDEDAADALLSQYDSYVIPSLTKSEIFYASDAWDAITTTGESK